MNQWVILTVLGVNTCSNVGKKRTQLVTTSPASRSTNKAQEQVCAATLSGGQTLQIWAHPCLGMIWWQISAAVRASRFFDGTVLAEKALNRFEYCWCEQQISFAQEENWFIENAKKKKKTALFKVCLTLMLPMKMCCEATTEERRRPLVPADVRTE